MALAPENASTVRKAGVTGLLFVALWLCACAIPAANAEPAITGPTWVAEDIGGRGVMDMLQSTLIIGEDGQVSGFGGCNGFFGKATIEGLALTFGPLGATRKLCQEAIMDQEDRYFAALAQVRSFEIRDGLLFLMNEEAEPLLRFWQRETD